MGWLQANMLYEKATKLPRFSTPTGMMFLMVYQMRQRIEFQKSRVVVQALMSQKDVEDDSIKKAFAELKEAFFPFDKNQRTAELKKMKDAMHYWIQHGPVVVEAQDDGRQNKKIASKLKKGQQNLAERKNLEKSGKITNINPYEKAKRRPRS